MNNKQQTILSFILLAICVVLRIASHNTYIANFTPILAMGLFAGSVIADKKIAIILPIAAMFITDLFFQLFTSTPGFYGESQIFNYVAFGLVALLGTQLKNRTALNVFGFSITGSLIFFVVSNLGVWLDTTYNLYPKNLSGLSNCFVQAILFYKNNFLSKLIFPDLLFSALFFGFYAFATRKPKTVIKELS
jgi:hypothetical protein